MFSSTRPEFVLLDSYSDADSKRIHADITRNTTTRFRRWPSMERWCFLSNNSLSSFAASSLRIRIYGFFLSVCRAISSIRLSSLFSISTPPRYWRACLSAQIVGWSDENTTRKTRVCQLSSKLDYATLTYYMNLYFPWESKFLLYSNRNCARKISRF